MAGKTDDFTSDIQHEVHIKFRDAGSMVEFHNVTVVEMLASIEMLRREVDRAMMQMELQRMAESQNGIQAIHGNLEGLKGLTS